MCAAARGLAEAACREDSLRWRRGSWAATKAAWSRGTPGTVPPGASSCPCPSWGAGSLLCKLEVRTRTSGDMVWDSAWSRAVPSSPPAWILCVVDASQPASRGCGRARWPVAGAQPAGRGAGVARGWGGAGAGWRGGGRAPPSRSAFPACGGQEAAPAGGHICKEGFKDRVQVLIPAARGGRFCTTSQPGRRVRHLHCRLPGRSRTGRAIWFQKEKRKVALTLELGAAHTHGWCPRLPSANTEQKHQPELRRWDRGTCCPDGSSRSHLWGACGSGVTGTPRGTRQRSHRLPGVVEPRLEPGSPAQG